MNTVYSDIGYRTGYMHVIFEKSNSSNAFTFVHYDYTFVQKSKVHLVPQSFRVANGPVS
jgi:hypothetical protein